MTAPTTPSIRERIDHGPMSALQIGVVAIGFMLNVVDGFDVVAMAVAAPALSAEWGLTATEKGYILSAVLFGMTAGAMFLAPLADLIGRRTILIFATALIGASMIATGLIAQSIPLLIAARVAAGLGIGVIFANGATIASEFATERFRNIAVITVVMGYPFGAMLVGPFANLVIPAQGWRMLFVYGGALTLAMTLVIALALPESVEHLAARTRERARNLQKINAILARMKRSALDALPPPPDAGAPRAHVGGLFSQGLARATLGLWAIYFLGFLAVYFLLSWIPTLFVSAGYARAEGVAALTYHNLGAVIGILIIGLIGTRYRLAKPIAAYFLGAAALLLLIFWRRPEAIDLLNALIFAIGFLLQGAFTAVYALAARVYPAPIRATGIGWAAGLGRTGAIAAPILAGYLVAQGWTMYALFALFAAPLVIAGALVAFYRH